MKRSNAILDLLKKIYAVIDGNKTIILTILWLAITKGLIPVNPEWATIIDYVMLSLTGASAVDHVRKGHLTANKN